MFDIILSAQFMAYLAGACYVLGFLIINQITLRLMVLAGTGFYIIYYFTVSDTPLWEAIYVSVLIGGANLMGLTGLLARNSQWAIPRAHKDIYVHFPGLPPGDFRTLVRLADRKLADGEVLLTTENAPLTKLYYIIDGETAVLKAGDKFRVPSGTFVGEVAYLKSQRASATTRLLTGAEYLEWSVLDLQNASARSARFKLSLEAVLSRDLAEKVSRSVAPFEPAWRPELAPYRPSSRPSQHHRSEKASPET